MNIPGQIVPETVHDTGGVIRDLLDLIRRQVQHSLKTGAIQQVKGRLIDNSGNKLTSLVSRIAAQILVQSGLLQNGVHMLGDFFFHQIPEISACRLYGCLRCGRFDRRLLQNGG